LDLPILDKLGNCPEALDLLLQLQFK